MAMCKSGMVELIPPETMICLKEHEIYLYYDHIPILAHTSAVL